MFKVRLALALALLYAGAMAHAQGNSEAAHVRSLNNSLLQLYGQLQALDASQGASIRSQASEVIAERFAALQTLIAEDPAAALQLAFDENLLAGLAVAFPDSASQLESHGTFEGPVDYVILDDATLSKHRVDITMKVAGSELNLHFTEHEPGWLKCNDIVRVSGVKAGDQVAAAGGEVTDQVASAGCTTTGDQKIIAILVNMPSYTLPSTVTPAMVSSIMFGTSGKSVHTYWQEASYGLAGASGVVVGPYQLSQNYTCDQYSLLRSAAIAAADAAVDFREYTRIMIVFPRPSNCGWAGLGTLGCSGLSSADGSFIASTSWLIANYMGDTSNGTKLSTHEGGHNLTLHHASSRAFTNSGTGQPEPLGAVGVQGSLSEYGSTSNTMGSWNFGQYDAPHKARLSWLSGSDIQTVQSNGSFSVQPFENNTGLRALKVQRGTGNSAWLWLEYRQAIGQYDSTLPAGVRNGALVHYEDSYTGTHTHLLDFTPGSSGGFNDAALSGNWTDAYTNLSVSVDAGTALGVTVSYGTVPCSLANPAISISPASQSGPAETNLAYIVTVTNNDTSSCSAATFDLSSTALAGWGSSFGANSMTLEPGQNSSTTLTKSAPAGTVGSFDVDTTATRGTNAATAHATANIVVAPSTVVSTDQTTYEPRSTVTITASVTSGGNPASGASVLFILTKADSSTTSNTVTTNSSGTATWNYRLGPKDSVGNYSVTALATYFGMADNSNASADFTVASSGGGGGKGGGGKGGGKPTK